MVNVGVYLQNQPLGNSEIVVGGVVAASEYAGNFNTNPTMSAVVPAGAPYYVVASGGLFFWSELR